MDAPAKGNVLGPYVPARYILAMLGFVGMLIIHGLNDTLSLSGNSAKVMFNHTVIGRAVSRFNLFPEPECSNEVPVSVNKVDGPLVWSNEEQSNVMFLKAYIWGYEMSLIIGARKAEMQSAKWAMLTGAVISIVCVFVIQLVILMNAKFVLAIIRFGQGVGAGVTYPAMHVLLAKWAPPDERSVMTAVVNSGRSLGPVISSALSLQIAIAFGWQYVFYIMGSLSVIWCFLWVILVEDSPQQQRLISLEERNMIVTSLGSVIGDRTHQKQPFVWRNVLRTPAFLVILVTHICSSIGLFSSIFWVPLYIDQVLIYDLTEDNLTMISTILAQAIFSIAVSIQLDSLRNKNVISTTTARKISTSFATVVPAICMISLCFIGCNRVGATVLWAVAVTASGGLYSGLLANHIDIAPNYAGTLIAFTDILANVSVPIFTLAFLFANTSGQTIFIATTVIYLIGFAIYVSFASSEVQSWNSGSADRENKEVTQPNVNNVENPNQPKTQDTAM